MTLTLPNHVDIFVVMSGYAVQRLLHGGVKGWGSGCGHAPDLYMQLGILSKIQYEKTIWGKGGAFSQGIS